jgi:hypothetical protein
MLKTMLYEIRRIWPLLAVVLLALLVFGDGAQLAVQLYTLSMAAMVVIVAHMVRKALFPYADMSDLVARAKESPAGAAVIFASIIAVIISLLLATGARADQIPERAKPLLPILSSALDDHWPAAPLPHITAGQVEQESAWKQQATLKTSRELGRGLAQLTIAYRADGSERFNSYRDAVRMRALRGWDWRADPYNARYQLTYLVLRDRAEFTNMRKVMIDDAEAWRAALVCYNAGQGRVLKRMAYAKAAGMQADRWAGGLEHAHGPGEAALLYGKPLWQAVNHYPAVVFRRAAKYEGHL